ncbi:sulfatase [Reichenbachiella carrageenanivorans]|uniref:Sulfatase n=1 Tax=Reichenbachiella carrageenanivorans TaxID=2979869 RepID=A0ABY6D6B0_9BACT|nr:sulfatase [Reichenbachiella carrageenanivorans]UXX79370.1 sulfatase [Reichenbachiella carrageenanivorans]
MNKWKSVLCLWMITILVVACSPAALTTSEVSTSTRPNILWIFSEDLSPFMGCYGDTINEGHTPVIDQLASEGVLFTKAYATAPVCSASRSAIITGMMQTTTGTHNHRSSRTVDGQIVPEELRIYLADSIKTLPELMQEAGYFTFNSGKDDYNFHYDRGALYNVGNAPDYQPGMNGWQGNKAAHSLSITEDTWGARPDKNQPWFGQIEIMGGKAGAKHVREGELLDTYDVPLPPYFPDVLSQRKAWTDHYNANRGADARVEAILAQLASDGEMDNTIVFFFSDHGSNTSLRHKQFCYEGGMLVPLMIKGNHPSLQAGTIRNELVSLLDVTATTLAMGGIELPDYLDGQDLFDKTYEAPEYVFGARDRCDYTIDRIRTVRSEQYRYIRNYFPERPMMQPGYRDNKPIVKDMKRLYEEGKLTTYQAAHWFGQRPEEELYDLSADPHQMNNLALDAKYSDALIKHRQVLEQWIVDTGDQGQYPEAVAQLKATYDLWKDRPRFRDAKVNSEYDQFRQKDKKE